MKKPFVVTLMLFLMLIVSTAGAHPPSEIKLTYDPVKQVLNIDIKHTTKSALKDRIREVIVTKNKEEPLKFYFTNQSAQGLTTDVPMKVAAGDVIVVKALSSQGGFKEETLKIQ